mgnify:CR=1 FL=1
MGLIKAIAGATGGILADQWKEYFYCDALNIDTMVAKGHKRISSRSSNTRGNLNIISNGSIISVADGQCMLIVEQGRIVDICAEPGEYIYDSSTEASIFAGKLDKDSIFHVLKNIGNRFGFGGEAPKDQRVYYINTKEFTGNPYGTPAPIPFRVVDKNAGLDLDITIRCFGEYSYKITNPVLFYTNVCGNVEDRYLCSQINEQLKSELLTSLQPAFAEISEMGIRYSVLPRHTLELADSLNKVLSERWKNIRGIEIASIGISSIKAGEKDEEIIKELQRNAAFRDPTMAAAQLVGAQAVALQEAARNQSAGSAMAFMGMNLAGQVGGISAQELFKMGRKDNEVQLNTSGVDSWKCSCGKNATGLFCSNCGSKRPENQDEIWMCSCGRTNSGIFCPSCGAKKPEKMEYVCSNCGWESGEIDEILRFCPHCGKSFN